MAKEKLVTDAQLPLTFSNAELLRQLKAGLQNTSKLQREITLKQNEKDPFLKGGSSHPIPRGYINISASSTKESVSQQVTSHLRGWEPEAIAAMQGAASAALGLVGAIVHIKGAILIDRQSFGGGTPGLIGSARMINRTDMLDVETTREIKTITIGGEYTTTRLYIDYNKQDYYFELSGFPYKTDFEFVD